MTTTADRSSLGSTRHRSARAGLVTLAAAGATVLGLSAGGGAVAAPDSPYTIGPDVKVSGPSSLAGCTAGASADFASAYDDTEVEPQIAVNPTNPDEMFAASQQDRWPDGGARGLTAWHSTDGGSTWAKTPDVPWSACQGGPTRFGRVTDPWVSYDKAGNLYYIGQPIDLGATERSAISVTTWNGTSWTTPQILIEETADRFATNDKVSVTGDPTRAGYAYATWLRGAFPPDAEQSPTADQHSFAWRGYPMLSRTTDAGVTWSAPQRMRDSNSYFQGNQIAVAPDGTLYNVAANLFTGAGLNANGVYMAVMRSTDGGRHWSAPVKVAPLGTAPLSVADDGFPVRAGDYIPDIAIDPQTGAIYVVWSDALGTSYDKIVMSRSVDGGRHWSKPEVVSQGGPETQAYNHAVEVTANGTLVVTYYDDRNNVLGDGVATTDIWVRHSHDGGATWAPEQHLNGPFDLYDAPVSYFAPGDPRGLFLGDYVGLETTSGDGVVALFPSTVADGADVHSVRLTHP